MGYKSERERDRERERELSWNWHLNISFCVYGETESKNYWANMSWSLMWEKKENGGWVKLILKLDKFEMKQSVNEKETVLNFICILST